MSSRVRGWAGVLIAMICLGSPAAVLGPGEAAGQLRDPPLGWDMWDPGRTEREVWRPDRMDRTMRWRMTRHWTFMQEGPPPDYQDARNPLTASGEVVEEGRALYLENCASCHDPAGSGHGEAGLALWPSPALLAHLIRMPHAVDSYLLWAIADGGEPLGSEMPAFADRLSREQIWQIVTFMRAGFPPAPAAPDAPR